MKFHVLTLFPDLINNGIHTSITGRAIDQGIISLNAINIRDFTMDKHGKVDDYTYGGGAGMLMQAQPVYDAWKAVCGEKKIRTVYVTPQGYPFSQKMAEEFATEEEIIFLCGHYEGIDQRVLEETVTDYVSIGDYVLTGGELPAMVMIDAISRLVPGVLNNLESAQTESFHNDLLEYPQYSRPVVWHEKEVPKVLMSGNHKEIEKWRLEAAVEKTQKVRPDLYQKYLNTQEVLKVLGKSKLNNAFLIDGLMRGFLELKGKEKTAYLAKRRAADLWMLVGLAPEEMLSLVESEQNISLLVHNLGAINEMLTQKFVFDWVLECYQAVYTQKEAMPVPYKDIRLLGLEHLEYVVENYEGEEGRSYVLSRIKARQMYGAFLEDELVGFVGMHPEGSVGILYVDPKARRMKIGTSLTAFMVNQVLCAGGLPYCHVVSTNEASLGMVQKMGFYIAKGKIYWLGKNQ